MHGVHVVTALLIPRHCWQSCGLVGLVAIAIAVRRISPLTSFGICGFLSSSRLPLASSRCREGMAEHRAYLASAGVVMALAGIVLSKQKLSEPRTPDMLGLAVVTAIA